jgi:hypothetical protein
MARPRIFISSTFFDLRQVRADLDRFIKEMGYDPIRNEQGNIPYGKEEKLEEYCYKEIGNIDILVSIIGGRFGSVSSEGSYSISQMEVNTALKLDKQVFIFIEKNVYAEFRTYLSNKDNKKVKYHYVDDPRIYEYIDFLEALQKNNPIQAFESSEEIIFYLREQWAGLFQRFLQEQRRFKEVNILQGIENTANTLNQLINYLADEKKDTEFAIKDILISNHPAFDRLKKILAIPYRVFFLTKDELSAWLNARSYKAVAEENWDHAELEEWVMKKDKKQHLLKVAKALFDVDGNLKPIKKDEWKDDLIRLEVTDLQPTTASDDDLPF